MIWETRLVILVSSLLRHHTVNCTDFVLHPSYLKFSAPHLQGSEIFTSNHNISDTAVKS